MTPNDSERMQSFGKYIQIAKELNMENAVLIKPEEIFFDIRAVLKCRWGCEDFFKKTIKCGTRDTSFEQGIDMIKSYKDILMLHGHDAREMSRAVHEVERSAFLDGYYFAFGIRYCKLCNVCAVDMGKECPTPDMIRPCDQSLGIDVYKTARHQGLPCHVLKDIGEIQNRYGFVLID